MRPACALTLGNGAGSFQHRFESSLRQSWSRVWGVPVSTGVGSVHLCGSENGPVERRTRVIALRSSIAKPWNRCGISSKKIIAHDSVIKFMVQLRLSEQVRVQAMSSGLKCRACNVVSAPGGLSAIWVLGACMGASSHTSYDACEEIPTPVCNKFWAIQPLFIHVIDSQISAVVPLRGPLHSQDPTPPTALLHIRCSPVMSAFETASQTLQRCQQ